MKIVTTADLEAALERCKTAQPPNTVYSAELRILQQICNQLLEWGKRSLVLHRQPLVHQMVLQRWLEPAAEPEADEAPRG